MRKENGPGRSIRRVDRREGADLNVVGKFGAGIDNGGRMDCGMKSF